MAIQKIVATVELHHLFNEINNERVRKRIDDFIQQGNEVISTEE